MPRRLLSAAAAGALLLGLASCGDGEEGPVTTAPPSINIDAPSDGGGDTEPSDGGGAETDEPTAAAPDIPPPDPAEYAGMDEQTEDGAIQAFRYYIAVSMWAHQTGDGSLSNTLEASNCISCIEFMETLHELQEHKKHWGEFSLSDVNLEAHSSQNYDFEIAYNFTTTPHERPTDDFTSTTNVGKLEYSTVGGMTWENDGWQVGAISAEWGENVLNS